MTNSLVLEKAFYSAAKLSIGTWLSIMYHPSSEGPANVSGPRILDVSHACDIDPLIVIVVSDGHLRFVYEEWDHFDFVQNLAKYGGGIPKNRHIVRNVRDALTRGHTVGVFLEGDAPKGLKESRLLPEQYPIKFGHPEFLKIAAGLEGQISAGGRSPLQYQAAGIEIVVKEQQHPLSSQPAERVWDYWGDTTLPRPSSVHRLDVRFGLPFISEGRNWFEIARELFEQKAKLSHRPLDERSFLTYCRRIVDSGRQTAAVRESAERFLAQTEVTMYSTNLSSPLETSLTKPTP